MGWLLVQGRSRRFNGDRAGMEPPCRLQTRGSQQHHYFFGCKSIGGPGEWASVGARFPPGGVSMRILVADEFPKVHLESLRGLGLTVDFRPGLKGDALAEAAKDVSILVVRGT